MLSSTLKDRLAVAGSRWTGPLNALLDRTAPAGLGGQFATGALLGAIGVFVLSGLDKRAEAALVGRMPAWLVDLTTRF